jgi:hypothetical protein
MADRDVLAIIWGETAGLKPKDNSPATMQRLQVVIGKLASAAKKRGLDRQLHAKQVPDAVSPDLTAFTAMQSAVGDAEIRKWVTSTPLPARAVLWEITESGLPPRDCPAPPAAAWILDPDTVHGGDFTSGEAADLKTFRLFESPKVPAEDELPYVSALTGSGVPAPKKPRRRWYKNVNWWIGLGGGALFLLVAFNLAWTAASFSRAYDLLTNSYPDQVEAFTKYLNVNACPGSDGGDICKDYRTASDSTKSDQDKSKTLPSQGGTCIVALTKAAQDVQSARKDNKSLQDSQTYSDDNLNCLKLLGYGVQYAARNMVISGNGWLSSTARWISWELLSWHVPDNGLQHVSLGTPMTLMMLGVVLVLVGLGRGVMGTPLGALISPQNRYSLALSQVTFWTVLILTSAIAIAIFNSGLVAEHMRDFVAPQATTPPQSASTALSSLVLGVFPDIPTGIWFVLGISLTSTVASSWIKWLKGSVLEGADGAQTPQPSAVKITVLGTPTEQRESPEGASIADWFFGEDAGTTDRIDISRVQMVMVTAGLLITYGQMIFASVGNLSAPEILLAVQKLEVLIPGLPVVGATMAIMLAVSHGTYLGAKAVSTTPAPDPKSNA